MQVVGFIFLSETYMYVISLQSYIQSSYHASYCACTVPFSVSALRKPTCIVIVTNSIRSPWNRWLFAQICWTIDDSTNYHADWSESVSGDSKHLPGKLANCNAVCASQFNPENYSNVEWVLYIE